MSKKFKSSVAATSTVKTDPPVETKELVETPEKVEAQVDETPDAEEFKASESEAPDAEAPEEVVPQELSVSETPAIQAPDEAPAAKGVDAEEFKAPEVLALPQPVQVIIESFDSYVIKTDPEKGTIDPDRLKVLQRELYYNILRMWRVEPKYLSNVLTAVDDIWTANIKGALAPTITWRHGSEINFPNAGASNLVCLSLAFFEAMAACKDTRDVTKIYRIDDLCGLIKPESAEALREYLN